jgi:hypothetical protein
LKFIIPKSAQNYVVLDTKLEIYIVYITYKA